MLSAYVALELWDVKKMGLAQPMKPGKSHDSFAARKKKQRGTKNATTNMRTPNRPDEYPAVDGNSTKRVCGGRGKRDAGCAVGILGSNVNQPWKIPFPMNSKVTYSRVKPSWKHIPGPLQSMGDDCWQDNEPAGMDLRPVIDIAGKCTNLTSRFVCR